VGNNKVYLIDRLLAIPLAIYFWWYGFRHKARKHRKKNLINATDNDVKNRNRVE
jgi:hypothetical protein